MDAMPVLLVVWGVLTAALAVLLIYRSALSMHEDDQLFLDNAESHLEKEQQLLRIRQDQLRPYVTTLAASSGLLVLLIVALWLWRGWRGM
jgi:hypothetical protein